VKSAGAAPLIRTSLTYVAANIAVLAIYAQPRFRITSWPNFRLPRPITFGPRDFGIEDDVLVPDERREPQAREEDPVFVAGETYLRLAELDLDDVPGIASFCSQFGRTLGVRHNNFAVLRDLPDFETTIRPRLEQSSTHPANFSLLALDEGIEDFRFGARCIRDLVRARRVIEEQDDETSWESLPAGSDWLPNDAVLHEYIESGSTAERRKKRRRAEAEAAVPRLANSALAYFQPQLVMIPPDGVIPDRAFISTIPLYAVCCAEFYNHVTDEAPYRTCANETCGRTFVKQVARAVKGQHRSHGVMYCSLWCARMQNQRKYRRRQAAARRDNA
jgi:hypothetical protein